MKSSPNDLLVFASQDMLKQVRLWLDHLEDERRLAFKTVEAYEGDLTHFLRFMTAYCGSPCGLDQVKDLRPSSLRGFLAERRRTGVGSRTLARELAALRSFIRFLERKGLANAAGINAMRSPKLPKSLPKPLTADEALRVAGVDDQLAQEHWIAARDAAVLALCYGCGMRISEVLSLTPAHFDDAGEASKALSRALRITGKGGKTRLVPVLASVEALVHDYRQLAPMALEPEQLLFRGARGGPLNPAIVQ